MISTTAKAPQGRGCGTRSVGGVYLCTGMSIFGQSIDNFVVDPIMPFPGDFHRGFVIFERNGISHVGIMIGESFYKSLWTFVEEAARFGISRKVPPNFPFERLTPGKSFMFFIHSKALLTHPIKDHFALDRDSRAPLEGCKFFADDPQLWEKNNPEFAGWHPTVRAIKSMPQQTACTFAHKDLACLFHPEKDIVWGESTEDGWNFQIQAPSFSYGGKTPVVPNVLKKEHIGAWSPGVFLRMPLTHVEFPFQVNIKAEQSANKAGFETVVLDY